ncbi:MAG TPA: DUF2007 domain-containing protein [Polyangiaceae bacterium]|nr:DUF2007 domain-containing protein [Polyangiaceae bacterium]
MQRLYRASNLAEAHLLKDLLEEDGLGACIVNENLWPLAGELPFGSVVPEVWVVDSRDVFMARAVLRDYLERKAQAPREDRTCNACGETSPSNFELCWRCRRAF